MPDRLISVPLAAGGDALIAPESVVALHEGTSWIASAESKLMGNMSTMILLAGGHGLESSLHMQDLAARIVDATAYRPADLDPFDRRNSAGEGTWITDQGKAAGLRLGAP